MTNCIQSTCSYIVDLIFYCLYICCCYQRRTSNHYDEYDNETIQTYSQSSHLHFYEYEQNQEPDHIEYEDETDKQPIYLTYHSFKSYTITEPDAGNDENENENENENSQIVFGALPFRYIIS